VSEGADKISFR
jgi:m7GpppX diphosphatase